MIIVNLSVQRSGTKSFEKFFSREGFKAVPWVQQNNAKWDIHAINKRYNLILESDLFRQNEVFSDTPFWDLKLADYIHKEIGDVFFVYLKRESKDWFKSLATHSKGMTFDDIKVHNYYYDRTADFEFLKSVGLEPKSLYIIDKFKYYTKWYEENHKKVLEFFSQIPKEKSYFGNLDNENVWSEIACKINLKLSKQDTVSFHFHKTDNQKVCDTKLNHKNLNLFFGSKKILERNYD